MRRTTIHSHQPVARQKTRSHVSAARKVSAVERMDMALGVLQHALEYIETMSETPGTDKDTLFHELWHYVHAVEQVGRDVERELLPDREAIRAQQREFRRKTDRFFAQSYFIHRARTWPQGYPGDYEIIERAYDNQSLSTGIGELLDRYFLTSTLCVGVRERRQLMQEVLAGELLSRRAPRVLNIGCGPCREVAELAPVIRQSDATFACVDFDPDALAYSAGRLRRAGIEQQVQLRRYNALRMINSKKNLAEFGRQDIIYSIGLLDYLTDEVLVKMLRALYAMLNPGGVLFAVFKDCARYETQDYHWIVEWDAFYQRTEAESRALIDRAGIAADAVTAQRTPGGVMIFYRLCQPHQARAETPAHRPHRAYPTDMPADERTRPDSPGQRRHVRVDRDG